MAVVFVVLAAIFAFFAWQNQTPAAITFFGWHADTSVGLAVLIPLVAGLVVGYLISWGKAQQLRILLRVAETRTKSAEAKLREQAHQLDVASDEQT
jgi:uncharacterized integral membrane protein